MSVSKDKQRGTWKVYIRYVDWQGIKQIQKTCKDLDYQKDISRFG